MTHRSFVIDGRLINVFDSQPGADKFKAEQDGNIRIVVRRKSYFARDNGLEMTINVGGAVSDQHQGAVQAAGQALIAEIETMIGQEAA